MTDYRDTVFLPKTDMPMKAKPADDIPLLGTDFSDMSVGPGRRSFHLHDGPPYANGDIHIGHAMNKILKDIIVRYHRLHGHDTPFVPSWDCHGLPIEWKVEEEFRAQGLNKNEVPASEFRQACRDYARHWVDRQREQFKRLNISADWDNTILTMEPKHEAHIMSRFHDLVRTNKVYRAKKPVLWSHVERTAMAEAETNDVEHDVPTVWVMFPIRSGPLHGKHLLVWTTTPWSLPGNVAVAYNPNIQYGVYTRMSDGCEFIVGDNLADDVFECDPDYVRTGDVDHADLIDANHPLPGYPMTDLGYCPLIAADFVRDNTGTGFVHIGPAHSNDDWQVWNKHSTEFPNPVGLDGRYNNDVPLFGGMTVVKNKRLGEANDAVVGVLSASGRLFRSKVAKLTLQHSWRSGALLLALATDQWFICLDGVKERARELVLGNPVEFYPEKSVNRLLSMNDNRPDWLVSRQRMWGTPLGLWVHRETGNVLVDAQVFWAAHDLVAERGSEAWFETSPEDFFTSIGRTDHADYERVDDILDVWFDSACISSIHGNVADLYLEGSDQSRGWFASSMMESVANNDRLPFRAILTHGFVLDSAGQKMSKSLKNVVDPQVMIDRYGSDVVRLWAASANYFEDIRVGDAIMKTHADTHRKIRNTLRYMVGALGDEKPSHWLTLNNLDRHIMARVNNLKYNLRVLANNNEFGQYMRLIHQFCNEDLSSLYFDVNKDRLYCDHIDSGRRNEYRQVLSFILSDLLLWLIPVMPVLVSEIKKTGFKSAKLQTGYQIDPDFERLLEYRRNILVEIDRARNAPGSIIRASGDAIVDIHVIKGSAEHLDLIQARDFPELLIVSDVFVHTGEDKWRVEIRSAADAGREKCARCWQWTKDVGSHVDHPTLCVRCTDVVSV